MNIPTGWQKVGEAIEREYAFPDFIQAFSFMTKVAELAEKAGHHPDWSNVYNKVHIRLSTHDTGTITEKDIVLAEAINTL
jgi:4a-hydroxytetrahydrobiopterin dehydratase